MSRGPVEDHLAPFVPGDEPLQSLDLSLEPSLERLECDRFAARDIAEPSQERGSFRPSMSARRLTMDIDSSSEKPS